MVSIDYCILTMEIMEIYHKCLSDNDSQISSSLAKGYDSGPPSLHPWQI